MADIADCQFLSAVSRSFGREYRRSRRVIGSKVSIPNHDVRTIVASLCGLLAFIGWKYSIQPDEHEFMWPDPVVAAQDRLRRPIGSHWFKSR